MANNELDTKALRRCLAQLQEILPTLQNAVPQLETLLQVAEAFGGLKIKGETIPEQKPAAIHESPKPDQSKSGFSKPIGKKDPDSVISKVESIIRGSEAPLSPLDIFQTFREKGWESKKDDKTLRHLIHGTIWHLKSRLQKIEGNAEEGYRMIRRVA